MASFTDAISSFNPYVQQLPVETMAQVGQQRQAQYNAGVQKIQDQVNNTAALDILHPDKKAYLQSKLDQLGSKLKSVAAGDFSNQQLVNSVGGMTAQIAKDPTIQSGVYDTQKIRSEMATANALYREGKSSINNVNFLNNQINEYLNTKGTDNSFTGKYVNYVDLNKKWQDLADNLKKNAPDNSVDNPYKTTPDGKTIYYIRDKKGNVVNTSTDIKSGGIPQPENAMKRVSIKGVSAQSMYEAIKNSLTADDEEQMKVDAWAHYRGQGPNTVLPDLIKSNQLAKDSLEKEISKLKVDLITSPNLSADDKISIQADINKKQAKLASGDFDKELQDAVIALQDPRNLESVKYQVYTKKFLNGKSVDLSNQSIKEEVLANPYTAVDLQRQAQQEAIRSHNLEHSDRQATTALGWAKLEEDKWKDKATIDLEMKKWQDAHPGIKVETRAISTDVVAPTVNAINDDVSGLIKSKNDLDNRYKDKLKLNQKELDDLYSRWIKNPKVASGNDEIDYLTMRLNNEKAMVAKQNILDLVNKGGKVYDDQLNTALANVKGIVGNDGKQVASGRDLWDVQALYERNLSKGYTTSTGLSTVNHLPELNVQKFLKEVGGDPTKQYIAKALVKQVSGQSLTANERIAVNQMTKVKQIADPIVGKIEKDRYDYEAKTIAKYDPQYQEQVGTIDPKNVSDMANLGMLIGNTIDNLNTSGLGVDLPHGAKLDAATLAKMMSDSGSAKEDVTATIVKNADGSAQAHINQGSSTQTIPVSAENLAKYYPEYAKGNPYNSDFCFIAANPNKTTNYGRNTRGNQPQDALTAAHTGYEIPGLQGTQYQNMVRYDIIGRDENDGHSNTDRFALRIFVNKNGTWIPSESKGGYVSGSSIQYNIENTIGPSTIEDILKNSK